MHGNRHRPAGPGGGQFTSRGRTAPAAQLHDDAQWHDPAFDPVRSVLARPVATDALARRLQDVRVRDAALQVLWGDGPEAATARLRHDWEIVMRPDAEPDELAIVGANPRVPIGVVLRHDRADVTVLRAVLGRVRLEDVAGGKLEDAYRQLTAA